MLFNFIKNVTSTVNEFIELLNKQGKATLAYTNRSAYRVFMTVIRYGHDYTISYSYINSTDITDCSELDVLNELIEFIQDNGFHDEQFSVEIQ